jgi:hypothetical protein
MSPAKKRTLVTVLVVLSIPLVGCVAGVLFVRNIAQAWTSQVDVPIALAAHLERDLRVVEAIGTPLEVGRPLQFESKAVNFRAAVGLEVPVEGPKGRLWVTATAKSWCGSDWEFTNVTTSLDGKSSVERQTEMVAALGRLLGN